MPKVWIATWAEAELELSQAYQHDSDFRFQRPSFTGGFQAEPNLHNTTVEEFREFQTHSRSNLKFYRQNNTKKVVQSKWIDSMYVQSLMSLETLVPAGDRCSGNT